MLLSLRRLPAERSTLCACDCGRFAESVDPILFASYGEIDKCEFIKVNAPEDAWEAWSSTDDGAGLLVKADALREQAREVLVSAARFLHSRAAASLLSGQPFEQP
jgi:hypothetical protein